MEHLQSSWLISHIVALYFHIYISLLVFTYNLVSTYVSMWKRYGTSVQFCPRKKANKCTLPPSKPCIPRSPEPENKGKENQKNK
jgi:hypothetical protein